ncbi:MAG: hypothetical protein MHPSP_003330, partial [Paramarteilia canceri]
KTLAFGIPLLNDLAKQVDQNEDEISNKKSKFLPENSDLIENNVIDMNSMLNNVLTDGRSLTFSALIIAPSRELCMQITKHLSVFSESLGLKILFLTGGMSHKKQKRLLEKKHDIIVGTPGRIYDYSTL